MEPKETPFATKIERFRPILLTLAEAMISPLLRRDLEASDLVQQTLMEAHQHADKLADMESKIFYSWLRTCLKHNLLDTVKRLTTQKQDVRRHYIASDLADSFDRLDKVLVADQTSPSQIVQRNEQVSILLQHLQDLPPNQRTAVIMKHLRGYSLRDIAESLGLTEPAVAGLLHRGRQHLVAAMETRGQD